MSLALATPVRSFFVTPRTVRLPLSGDYWIDVRERLNHGESEALSRSLYERDENGDMHYVPVKWNTAMVLTFLVDWNMTGDDGQVVPIRGVSREELAATIANLDEDDFIEIRDAVQTHVSALSAARAEKKRRRTIVAASSPI